MAVVAVGLKPPDRLLPVPGIRLAAISAGLYEPERPDLALLAFAKGAACSAVFTQNAFCAAPVQQARKHLLFPGKKFCLINAGNANAGTGTRGLADAAHICQQLADIDGCDASAVLPFSTGVIGEYLPRQRIAAALPALYARLAEDNWLQCAQAIMTTDTIAKGISKTLYIADKPITITGIAKGSGMIRPDMATMLAFIASDAHVEQAMLDQILARAVDQSFNRICVDGDTSTNDAAVLIATGRAGHGIISDIESEAGRVLQGAVGDVCRYLAQAIVRDGEGASKFITLRIEQGKNREECLRVASAIATSPLVKTAFFASAPNWGRVLAAIGRAGLKNLALSAIEIYLDDLCIVKAGQRAASYNEAAGIEIMQRDEIGLTVNLARGPASETLWTCDLSYEYVRINAEYYT